MKIDKDTKLFGSFSKQAGSTGCKFFNEAFEKYDINAIYKSFSVDNIEDAFKAARTLKISGFAVAMPYKVTASEYCDRIKGENCGNVNTILRELQDRLVGYNTDYYGVKDILEHYIDFTEHKHDVLNIIGTGGLASTINTVSKELDLSPVQYPSSTSVRVIMSFENSLIYNCTPMDLSFLGKNNTFIDCRVGTPDGDKLYKIQSRAQFKLYTGIDYEE